MLCHSKRYTSINEISYTCYSGTFFKCQVDSYERMSTVEGSELICRTVTKFVCCVSWECYVYVCKYSLSWCKS